MALALDGAAVVGLLLAPVEGAEEDRPGAVGWTGGRGAGELIGGWVVAIVGLSRGRRRRRCTDAEEVGFLGELSRKQFVIQ